MLARFPEADREQIVQTTFEQMTVLQDLIGAVRNLRGEMGIQPNVKAPLFVESADDLADYLKYLPMHLVEKDKADLAELEDKMAKVQTQLAKLKD